MSVIAVTSGMLATFRQKGSGRSNHPAEAIGSSIKQFGVQA